MAGARVMLPTPTGGGAISAILGDLDPAAASLLGASSGDYIRYMAILTSGTITDRLIEEFDLMDKYDTRDASYPRLETRRMLEGNVDFQVDREFDFLQINVLDRSPEQAAAMANYLVSELNELNAQMVSDNATTYRHFVQQRYDATIASLDSAMTALKEYQEQYGVIELEQQSQAFLAVLAEFRVAAFEAEVEYEALKLDFGADNPTVKSAGHRVQAAKNNEFDLLHGKDPLMPVALADIPEVGYGYAKAMREVLIHQKIIEFARPLLEQAIFEEQKVTPAVQVLDQALVPEKKEYPKRMIIVAASTMSVFILAILYLLGLSWLDRNKKYLSSRLGVALKQKE
jgi:capsule polysaccharide export protein KpsE/RkpR